MLERFMFAATLPDPRIGALLSSMEEKGEWNISSDCRIGPIGVRC